MSANCFSFWGTSLRPPTGVSLHSRHPWAIAAMKIPGAATERKAAILSVIRVGGIKGRCRSVVAKCCGIGRPMNRKQTSKHDTILYLHNLVSGCFCFSFAQRFSF